MNLGKTFALISALVSICQAEVQQRLDVEDAIFVEKWSADCQNAEMPRVAFDKYEAVSKALCEKQLELAKMQEKNTACQSQSNWQKSIFEGRIEALKIQEQLKLAKAQAEKNLLEQNCDLRVQLVELNSTSLQECQKKLHYFEKTTTGANFVQEKSEEIKAKDASVKLLQLSTGQYYISLENQKENWYMANKRCKSLGMELASLETKEENDLITNSVSQTKDSFWLSGTDLGSEGSFYWMATGQPFGMFSNWYPNTPDNYLGKEDCVCIWEKRLWNDNVCANKLRYICELL